MNNHVILTLISVMIIWSDYLGCFYLLSFTENHLPDRQLTAALCDLSSELKDGLKGLLGFQ